MDEIDAAQAAEEHLRNLAIAQAAWKQKRESPVATGLCLNCDEPLAAALRWCDADCARMWERIKAARTRLTRQP